MIIKILKDDHKYEEILTGENKPWPIKTSSAKKKLVHTDKNKCDKFFLLPN